MSDKFITVLEYAERERVSKRTVYHWIEKGAIKTVPKVPPSRAGVLIVDPRQRTVPPK